MNIYTVYMIVRPNSPGPECAVEAKTSAECGLYARRVVMEAAWVQDLVVSHIEKVVCESK